MGAPPAIRCNSLMPNKWSIDGEPAVNPGESR